MAKKAKKAASAGNVVDSSYEYETTRIQNKDGSIRHTRGNGDAIAKAMLVAVAGGVKLEKIISANKLGDKFKPAQYDNQGLLRMSLGNTLRGMVRNGTPVTIGDVTVKSLDQNVKVPEVKDAPKKAAAKPKAKKAAKKAKTARRKAPAAAEAGAAV